MRNMDCVPQSFKPHGLWAYLSNVAGRGEHPEFRVLTTLIWDNYYLGSDSTVQAVSSIFTASWEFQ